MGANAGNHRVQILRRTAQLLMHMFPRRPDLPYQLLVHEPTGSLLKGAPKISFNLVSGTPTSILLFLSYKWLGCRVAMRQCGWAVLGLNLMDVISL